MGPLKPGFPLGTFACMIGGTECAFELAPPAGANARVEARWNSQHPLEACAQISLGTAQYWRYWHWSPVARPRRQYRIHAVMPMAAAGAWLYGERGLTMADRPMLLIGPTEDEYNPCEVESAYIFEHAGSPEAVLVSFVGKGHMMVFRPEQAMRMNHFATAFFGYYLQGKEEYANYFSEDFEAIR